MDGVYNRKLFAKKSEEARNKLRQIGGVEPMPSKIGGILASSPELMQAAAMRQPIALSGPQSPMPMPMPMTQMLPPSQPIPNIAGISQGSAPATPAQKPGVAKFNEGGSALADQYMTPKLQAQMEKAASMQGRMEKKIGMSFGKAFEFGSTAITTENPAALGLPEGANMRAAANLLKNPEMAATAIIADTVPKEERTGDIKTDLRKAATASGVESIPVEAEIDELNRAIFGATMAGAIAGDYVNPSTGQALRPSSGKRIANAAVQGLAVQRETEERRAAQEATLAAANISARARAKPGKGFLETSTGKSMLKFVESQGGKDMLTDAQINEYLTNAYGANMVTAFRSALGAQAAAINTPSAGGTPAPAQTVDPVETANVPGDFVIVEGETAYIGNTPINKDENGIWRDAEGNNRNNG
jgi:hypothetical protein